MTSIDVNKLSHDLREKRVAEGLSFADLAEVVGVSASNLARIESKAVTPKPGTLMAIVRWLGVPVGSFIKSPHGNSEPIIYYPSMPMPDIVRDLLNADVTLSRRHAQALEKLFRAAYRELTGQGE